MEKLDYLGQGDISLIENLYQQYLSDPQSIEESWKKFFEGFEFARNNFEEKPSGSVYDKEFKVINLIEGYRRRGHLFTETNPVRSRRKYTPTLDIETFGLEKSDLDTVFEAGKNIGIGPSPLSSIVEHLKQTYCRSIGAEYGFIRKPEVISWLQDKMEPVKNTPSFSPEEKKHFYFLLKQAVGFENYIHKKFIGAKRFSLEGTEALIPALDAIIEKGSNLGIEEFTIGMSHRGRLNVLANILQKPYEDIFNEFNGKFYDSNISLGDVKYHLGYSNRILTKSGKKVKLNLAPNPSHLEAVGPVVEGITRAKIDHTYNDDFNKIAPILIHGDAAIASQGIVYEVLQMSNLKGYGTGGTIHLVINNQVGFTTSYLDARSSTYCTDIGKVTKAPIFHVNGDDVESLVFTIMMAMEFRQTFHSDVFIDILSYRKYGHSEGDEPRFTQPLLYKKIANHPNPREIYGKKLILEGVYSQENLNQQIKDFEEVLDIKLEKSKKTDEVHIQQFLFDDWQGFKHPDRKELAKCPRTGIKKEELVKLAKKINHIPKDKKFFKKLIKLIDQRLKMINNNQVDWAMGELLAYASLLVEGHPVRISGQDVERGTFSHRHASFIEEDTGDKYYPLKHLSKKQGDFSIYNSPLSEYGVLGFEYGYALAKPDGLTIWEAQFGDFYNVAQVIVDQYISSAEEKWGLMNGLVMYLPHGFEGQGPEHSSARIERFLSLAANNNMQIVQPTTPASLFHVIRRQLTRQFMIPMLVFTPKSLLRHPLCISTLDEFEENRFQEVLDDQNVEVDKVLRLIFCTGKVYYDLLKRKQELQATDIAIIRLEQLHPFPKIKLDRILKKYKNAILHLWVQEEPENMGAWRYVREEFKGVSLIPVARLSSGSPATGLHGLHDIGQKEIVD
ncbi:MAG: 2-oxoglutarate dehydrogenase E1 component, partial [Bacteroidales bacterium]|nr:2-oxoglutarate dehydrogenase E1 component [Bacteroidales bacterium]